MEYYLVQNLGYDGLTIDKFSSLEEAELGYKSALGSQEHWDEKHPGDPSDKGLVMVRGEVVLSDSLDVIFG